MQAGKTLGQRRVVLCGYYGLGNGGDEALLATLLQMLPPTLYPVVLSGNPAQTRDRYGVEAVQRKAPLAVLQALSQAEALIWGGGSLMQDVTSAANPLYYGGLMIIAQQMGLKTVAWAQGIGPLNRPLTRWLTEVVYRRCTRVSVRDVRSAQYLRDWQIPFSLAPDPVWGLTVERVPSLWQLPAPRVAVSLRSHSQLTPTRLTTLTQALVDFQKATSACLILLPFQPQTDQAIATAIQTHLPGPNQILSLEDPRQLKGVFRGVEMAISMRLHGLIMAASEGCRCFALSYDPKVSQLMTELTIPGWELSDLPDRATSITQAWLEHYANGKALSPEQLHTLSDRANLHRDLLYDTLSPR
jgi:polysaccharide pyruvyl transferase CsaB